MIRGRGSGVEDQGQKVGGRRAGGGGLGVEDLNWFCSLPAMFDAFRDVL